ncbi:hypothetical protein ACQP00_22910 [Dactylosporangium sp. CS-047395]|uniref:hypothetical protein n=1 Tax=Dactylosporangium sp. CS-047395 TaxID=3239936 RepID=UPI003D8B0C8F
MPVYCDMDLDEDWRPRGTVFGGLMLSLGVYLLALAGFVAATSNTPPRHPQDGAAIFAIAGVAGSIAVAIVRGLTGRRNSAFGAAVGTLVWPLVAAIAIALLMALMASHMTVV